jgi:hypothetical protein
MGGLSDLLFFTLIFQYDTQQLSVCGAFLHFGDFQ